MASQTHATRGITCDGAPLDFLEIKKEKLEQIRSRVLDVLTLVTWELMPSAAPDYGVNCEIME